MRYRGAGVVWTLLRECTAVWDQERVQCRGFDQRGLTTSGPAQQYTEYCFIISGQHQQRMTQTSILNSLTASASKRTNRIVFLV